MAAAFIALQDEPANPGLPQQRNDACRRCMRVRRDALFLKVEDLFWAGASDHRYRRTRTQYCFILGIPDLWGREAEHADAPSPIGQLRAGLRQHLTGCWSA